MERNRQSKAPDLEINPNRKVLNLLQQVINAGNKLVEFSIPVMLLDLMGMKQYACSESYTYINVYNLRRKVFELAKKKNDYDSDTEINKDYNESNNIENDEYAKNADETLKNEIENDEDGNCTITKNNKDIYVIVTVEDDYFHRGNNLKDVNNMEYRVLVIKELTPDKDKDNDDDSSDSDDDNKTNENNEKIKKGRPAYPRFDFQRTIKNKEIHAQTATHSQVLKSKHSIPVLTSKHIPLYPGLKPTDNNETKNLLQWQKEADDFGSFFLTLMVPLSLNTGLPSDFDDNSYDLNFNGKSRTVILMTCYLQRT